jgi:Protein of unknown function (DUF1553)/Protein of unknown function (DUF1549)/Planctomycete cytochrome C
MPIGRSSIIPLAPSLLIGMFVGFARGDSPPIDAGSRARELLAEKCLACHSPDPRKGGLDLTRRASALLTGKDGAVVVPGRPDESLLIEKIESGEMPPGRPLEAGEIAAFRGWIESGAAYEIEPLLARRAGPDWWSLRPIRRVPVPAVKEAGWVRTPIDAFLLDRLERDGLGHAPPADRATFLRRVSFDLIGLPPTPEEVDAFVADRSPDAFERLVDRLLDSPRYGERWGRHWLDVVRFAESHGYETNSLRPDAWPYRDYAIRAFNHDTPFARFVEEQLAGDALPDADWLARSATGFLVAGSHDVVGNQAPEAALQQRADDLDDMIAATSTAFLGLTVQCARCHDHKFDPIAQRDYYGLQAAFAGVTHASREIPRDDPATRLEADRVRLELGRLDRALDDLEPLADLEPRETTRPPVSPIRNVERFEPVEARFVRLTIDSTDGGSEPCLDELEVWSSEAEPRNVASADLGGKPSASSSLRGYDIHRVEHLNDGRYGNARSWISAEAGRGWAQVEFRETTKVDRVIWGRDREAKYADRTAVDYRVEVALEPGVWRVVASSRDRMARSGTIGPEAGSTERARMLRLQDELRKKLESLGSTVKVYAGTFSQPGPTRLLRRGDPLQPLEPLGPSGVKVVGPSFDLPMNTPEADRRLALARWIADPANPLPARVMVNRAWHYHFGRGLVSTPSDFGFNGDRPSHPELLDWLAGEYLANGGRLKPIHRLIVLSNAYRQSSRLDERARSLDGDNRRIWRFSPRRLEAEEIRDAILSVSGTLDLAMGGPGYDLWRPNTNYVVVFEPKVDLGPETFRRMVYQFRPRSQPDPTFGAFDCPDGGLVAPRRNSSTTALQALNLLNSRFVLDQAGHFAARLAREAGPDPVDQADRAFRLAFGRAPSVAEREAAASLIRDHGAVSLCRALFNANEFLHVP